MAVWFLIFEIFFVAVLVAYLSFHFGRWKKQHLAVTVASFLACYVSLLILSILPLDVSMTYFARCLKQQDGTPTIQPANSIVANSSLLTTVGTTTSSSFNLTVTPTINLICHPPLIDVDQNMLTYFWHIVYWTSLCLTWCILPIMQSYAKAGDVRVGGKIKSTIKDNAIYYGTYLIIVLIIGTYLLVKKAIKLDMSSLKVLIITASNTWGLFLVIVFLGYGLVEVPRGVWISGDPSASLRRALFQLSRLSEERVECEEQLEDVLHDVKRYYDSMPITHPNRDFIEIIMKKSQCVNLPNSSTGAARINESINNDDSDCMPSYSKLVKLHAKLKRSQHQYSRSLALWRQAIIEACWLEDVENNRGSRLREFRSGINPAALMPTDYDDEHFSCSSCSFVALTLSHLVDTDDLKNSLFCLQMEWYWKCVFRPVLLKLSAVILAAASLSVVWSECTFFVAKPVLSLLANLLQVAARDYNFLFINLVCFFTLGYLSFVVYFTVFRLRIFNYFRLVPNHQTDENSLIFCGMLLCRLTPPLCLNFLGLIHMDSHIINGQSKPLEETAYTKFMGHLDVVRFIASGFNLYFPILVLVLCIVTYLRVGTRCLHQLGIQQFISADDEQTQSCVEEGRALLKRERILLQRKSRHYDGEDSDRRSSSTTNGDLSSHSQSLRSIGRSEPRSEDRGKKAKRYPPLNSGGAGYQPIGSERSLGQNMNDRSRLLDFQEPLEYNEEVVNEFLNSDSNTNLNRSRDQKYSTSGKSGGKSNRSLFDD